jgi:hypothetical protein
MALGHLDIQAVPFSLKISVITLLTVLSHLESVRCLDSFLDFPNYISMLGLP